MGFSKARVKANLTQAQVADALHIDQSTVSMWETGRTMPRAGMLPKIAELYACDIADLLIAEVHRDDEYGKTASSAVKEDV